MHMTHSGGEGFKASLVPGSWFQVPGKMPRMAAFSSSGAMDQPADLTQDVQRLLDDLAKGRPDRRHVVTGECMPVVDVFETLNSRIRFLYDRDHQLGHSYFLDIADVQSLRQVFVDRIIPMLQEYFYGAWDKICVVLGCPYGESGEPRRRA